MPPNNIKQEAKLGKKQFTRVSFVQWWVTWNSCSLASETQTANSCCFFTRHQTIKTTILLQCRTKMGEESQSVNITYITYIIFIKNW